ncbi:MAG: hypothetical protein M3Q74_12260 [Pseudomonadota bacterium]|nr:hypothetical protein [Pseudomonadota bacterium]
METAQVPALAYVVFGLAFACGLALFACLFVITRRLGMEWRGTMGSYSLNSGDNLRVGKLLFGVEKAPDTSRVGGLLVAVRVLWLAMVLLIIAFAAMLAGIV